MWSWLLSQGISEAKINGESNEDLALPDRSLGGLKTLEVHLVETWVSNYSKAKVNAKPSPEPTVLRTYPITTVADLSNLSGNSTGCTGGHCSKQNCSLNGALDARRFPWMPRPGLLMGGNLHWEAVQRQWQLWKNVVRASQPVGWNGSHHPYLRPTLKRQSLFLWILGLLSML